LTRKDPTLAQKYCDVVERARDFDEPGCEIE